MIIQAKVDSLTHQTRLDVFLMSLKLDGISRTSIQKLIKSGNIKKLDETITLKSSYIVSEDETFEIKFPETKPPSKLEPIDLNIPIVKDFEDFLIINKPAGLASHGTPGNHKPTLVNGLIHLFNNLSTIGGEMRPGIVHRLDKGTSGLMIIAKNDKAHIALSELFQKKLIEKRYYAYLIQSPSEPVGTLTFPIARHPFERIKMIVKESGRKAITHYKIIDVIRTKKGRKFSLAEIRLETGRTHQIRVHFQHAGCPVVGDILYSRSANQFSKYGLLLFSQQLKFKHPFKNEIVEVELPFPENFIHFKKEAELF